jgi:phage-related minor tail protein
MTTTEVGVGYVRLLPSMEGFAAAARRELGSALAGPARDAGEEAGKEMGKGLGDGLDRSKGQMEGSVAKVGKIFKTGLAAAGVAAGALMAAGISGALEQEVATDKLAAQLGGGEFGRDMGKIAGTLYGQAFGDSLADTGAAIRKVWQNGLVDDDATDAQIERVTAKLLTFSDVMEQDMDMATQAVSSMLKTGIADSADEAFDILTRGIQQGADKAGDLLETFQEYSTQFRALGINATEATGLMRQGLGAGARDADKVADALKELAIRGKDGSNASAEGFRLLGLNAREMTDQFAAGGSEARRAFDQVLESMKGVESQTDQNTIATSLFGAQSEDLQAALFALDLDSAASRLGTVEGATDKLGSAYDNASTKIESFKRQSMQQLIEFVGGTVIPGMERLAQVIGPPLREALAVAGQIVDDFRAAWQRLAPTIVPVLEEMWAKVKEIMPQVQELISSVLIYVQELVQFWVGVVGRVWRMWGDEILLVVRTAFNLMWSIVSGALDILTGLFKVFTAELQGEWGLAWEGIKQIVSGAWTIIKGLFVAAFNVIRAVVSAGWSLVVYLFGSGFNAVMSLVSSGIDSVIGFFRGMPGRVRTAFSSLASAITSPFSSAFASIKKLWNDTLGGFGFSVPKWVPKIGGNSFKLPKMHTGGIVGGVGDVPIMAQGGEGVFTRDQMRALGVATMAPSPASAQVVISADGDQEFLRWLRQSVRVVGGGNVQMALGS